MTLKPAKSACRSIGLSSNGSLVINYLLFDVFARLLDSGGELFDKTSVQDLQKGNLDNFPILHKSWNSDDLFFSNLLITSDVNELSAPCPGERRPGPGHPRVRL